MPTLTFAAPKGASPGTLASMLKNDLPALLRVLISDTLAKNPKPALVDSNTKSSGWPA